jgi:Ca2+-binding EF-hand superfamily protein
LEDVRSLFKSADTDMSGYLSADELYKCLHRMGADVTKDEVV